MEVRLESATLRLFLFCLGLGFGVKKSPIEQKMVERGSTKSFANLSIRLPTPEDLIIMKAIAHRPKDLEDIRTIAEKYPNLDKNRIEEWINSFGEVLEMPGLWNQVKVLLG